MTHTDLGDDLSITDVPEGLILQWVSTETAVVDAFIVNMSPNAVCSLEAALSAARVEWTSEDRSLVISGDRSSLTLTFQMQEPPLERMALKLDTPGAVRFRAEIAKRASEYKKSAVSEL